MRLFTVLVILTLTPSVNILYAEAWVRGAATIVQASGGVKITLPADGVSYEAFDQPKYFSGIFNCTAQAGGSVLMQTSNEMILAFRGAGFFSVERLEGLYGVDGEGDLAETQSRVILNLRRGELLIDSRQLPEDSKLILETPFGRISGPRSIMLVQIEFDYRSEIYSFTISSVQGSVRLSDLRKQSYTIYAGQRISGAGSYSEPAIEVAGQTEQIREKFNLFFETLDGLDPEKVDRAELRAHTQTLPEQEALVDTSQLSTKQLFKVKKRPRVIEFAPRAEPISPFRGEVKPPSDFQADLF